MIRRALLAAAAHEQVQAGAGVGVLVCDDDEIRALNARFAGEDHATDVLSFPAEAPPGVAAERELGDIVISLPRVRAQAAAAGHDDEREIALLAVHGFLHLLGYDHATEREAREMFARTDAILAAAGL